MANSFNIFKRILVILMIFLSSLTNFQSSVRLTSAAATALEVIEHDFRYISFQDLLPVSDRFTDNNVTSFTRLLFDVARDQVIVGARDVLYRMSFALQPREKSVWEATMSMMVMCQDKGQSEEDCRNHIMVLQNYGNQLYACGTYAFSPNCSWRQMENLTVIRYDKGVAKCPFNPHANITTFMTESGQMFVGSTTDFSGSDAAILRADISQDLPQTRMLRTNQYNSKWLNDPQFVGSFENGEFIYFIFRETAVEYINCGKIVYSRIARVCKSDPGGEHILKDNWTSFLKARLNCSIPGEYPFYFNEVQGITYSPEEGILYATFTTPINSIAGSAICAFNMSAINIAFQGPFKHQETMGSAWGSVNSPYRAQYECKSTKGPQTLRYNQLLDASKYQLMDMAVQPITTHPLHIAQLERFRHLSLDIVSTKLYERVHVLYVSTDKSLIKKISVLPRTKETCVVEIWRPEPDASTRIHTIEYLKETDSLYIGSDQALMRISAQHCNRHASRPSCLNAMDPYCGWNELLESCTAAPNGDTLVGYWIQNATECPILTAPVEGSWSAWSDWFKCAQSDGSIIDDFNANVDTCLCRTRTCDNPSPKNGGRSCTGMSISVSNCTLNGGWTEWSAWSACSQTCGVAVKTRRRTCGNPKPAHGGRVCVGPDRAELYCSQLPPCPVPKQPPIDGNWGPWGAWSDCSSQCGGGFRYRRRKCDDPKPQNGGMECSGCHIEYENCNNHQCPEIKKTSSWTPWLTQMNGSTVDTIYMERRFKFACKSSTSDPSQLKISLSKEETRFCNTDGTCQRANDLGDEAGWSDWSQCSVSCGGGQQFRNRVCDHPECEGKLKMARACNTHPCSEWSCWSEWSACSVTCGVGFRRRTRKCLSDGGECEGKTSDDELCEMPLCESFLGWSSWSEWSDCNENGERLRFRKCLTTSPSPMECQGDETEYRACESVMSNEITAPAMAASSIWAIVLGVAMACSFLSFGLTYYMMRKRYLGAATNSIPTSPCYDSYPNQYSSLPTKDYLEPRPPKVKRQSSFNSNGGTTKNIANGHGTLTKTNNVTGNHTPKVLSKSFADCETATIKRNSHGLNNTRPNRNIDDEKF